MPTRYIRSSLICTLVVMLSNALVPSQSNGFIGGFNFSPQSLYDSEVADIVYQARKEDPVFQRRPLVLTFQKLAKELFKVPYQFSFNLINYVSLFFFFLILPRLNQAITGDRQFSVLLQYVFLFSFPIIFAFYGSIFTYDDFLQYLLIAIFLIFYLEQKLFISAMFFLLACICRETSFLYLIFVMFVEYRHKRSPFTIITLWTIVVISYIVLNNAGFSPQEIDASKKFFLQERFYAWRANFRTWQATREVIVTTILTIGIPGYMILKKHGKIGSIADTRKFRIAATLLIVNTLIVFSTALVREARLLFLPLIFCLPLVKNELAELLENLKSIWKKPKLLREGTIIFLSFCVAFVFYHTQTVGTGYIFKVYAFVYFIVFFSMIVLAYKPFQQ